MDITNQIDAAGKFLEYGPCEWQKLKGCPHKCPYLFTAYTKWLCNHPNHPLNSSQLRFSQRRKTLYLNCPMKGKLKLPWVLEILFFKWWWKYHHRYTK